MSDLRQELSEIDSPGISGLTCLAWGSFDGLWYWDLTQPAQLWIDEQLWQSLGYEGRDATARLAYWQDLMPAPDGEAWQAKALTRAREQHAPQEDKLRLRQRDGTPCWMRCRTMVLRDEQGHAIRMLGAMVKVPSPDPAYEEIAQTLKNYQGIIDNQSVYVIKLDRDGTYTFVNDYYCQDFRWKRADIVGQSSALGIIEEHIPEAIEVGQKAFRYPDQRFKQILTKELPDGTRKVGEWEFSALVDEHGIAQEILCIGYDITKLVEYQRQLEEAKAAAEAASLAKSDFLANMSHEIRTPLNSVIGFSELLMKTPLDATQRDHMQYVHQSAHALLDLINDILDFSKIEAGKLELGIEKTDLKQLCQQIIDFFQYKTSTKGLTLSLDLDPALPTYVFVDPVRLRQVLLNLVSNAVKFTDQGSVVLRASLVKAHAPGDSELRFAVEDTGIGIQPDRQAEIFEAFSQEDASITRKYGGTGLGLSISNQLLTMMESKLALHSQPGEGSTFFFQLRLATQAEQPPVWQQVLIVADQPDDRARLEALLAELAIPYHAVANGLEALAHLSEQTTDLVLMAQEMPFMTGLEVARKIREDLGLGPDQLAIVLLKQPDHHTDLLAQGKAWGICQVASLDLSASRLHALLSDLHQPLPPEDAPPAFEADKPYDILVVDDNAINRVLARSLIQSLLPMAQLREAADGQAAVDLLVQARPDLILMDVQMPTLSGYDATREIRRRETDTHVPIIALTAGTVKGEETRCLEAGMDAFLTKPVDEAKLQRVLVTWLSAQARSQPVEAEAHTSPQLQHFNRAQFMARMGEQGPQMLQDVVQMLEQGTLLTLIEQAQDLLQDGGQEAQIRALAHNLKGGSSSVGLEVLARQAETLEKMLPLDPARALALVEDMKQEHALVLAQI